jgi:hypothetical protein
MARTIHEEQKKESSIIEHDPSGLYIRTAPG